jgi:hypothetical protein
MPKRTLEITTTDWKRLSPAHFESFCGDLLRALGFENIHELGGSGDRARDIICERTVPFGLGLSAKLRWVIQCKHTLARVDKATLLSDLASAQEHHPDFWWLLTTAQLSPGYSDWLMAMERNPYPFRLDYLDRRTLGRATWEFPRLLGRHFPQRLGSADKLWTAAIDAMVSGEYDNALTMLTRNDDSQHPRISYLQACCHSMLAKAKSDDAHVVSALESLRAAHNRRYLRIVPTGTERQTTREKRFVTVGINIE